MTVPAIDPQAAHVVLVRECHWLGTHDPDLRLVGRLKNEVAQEHQTDREQQRAEDRQPRQRVGTRVKDLRHITIRDTDIAVGRVSRPTKRRTSKTENDHTNRGTCPDPSPEESREMVATGLLPRVDRHAAS